MNMSFNLIHPFVKWSYTPMSPNMMIIELNMVIEMFWAPSLIFSKHMSSQYPLLGTASNHMPFQHRCPRRRLKLNSPLKRLTTILGLNFWNYTCLSVTWCLTNKMLSLRLMNGFTSIGTRRMLYSNGWLVLATSRNLTMVKFI